jgi:hypothetical protein
MIFVLGYSAASVAKQFRKSYKLLAKLQWFVGRHQISMKWKVKSNFYLREKIFISFLYTISYL